MGDLVAGADLVLPRRVLVLVAMGGVEPGARQAGAGEAGYRRDEVLPTRRRRRRRWREEQPIWGGRDGQAHRAEATWTRRTERRQEGCAESIGRDAGQRGASGVGEQLEDPASKRVPRRDPIHLRPRVRARSRRTAGQPGPERNRTERAYTIRGSLDDVLTEDTQHARGPGVQRRGLDLRPLPRRRRQATPQHHRLTGILHGNQPTEDVPHQRLPI